MIKIITYDKLWETMKSKGISQYKLVTYYGISTSQLQRLKLNKYVTTSTLAKFCKILECKIEDIVTYIPDKK